MDAKLEAAAKLLHSLQERLKVLGLKIDPEWRKLSPSDLRGSMAFLEARSRNECSDMLQAMIDESQPLMLDHHRYFVWLRCQCALDTIFILSAELDEKKTIFSVPSKTTPEELLRWLLIDNWNVRHDIWLRLTSFSILTGNTYYSGVV